ncbi:GSCFA domain-containing protein [Pontibacter sp. E15-1]|uniref:GSCFA domain-containing protein n=1 Tax=Pontibacter sp. E15-1 TaxID=2919918 RepID=UPI001F4F5C9C|nr:GSCFA domain-containing protein [Pontibacter sp. E15-1]MCJ8165294.1 GSCFA domain-containing protein [Pontibacter sp. E15-1]
MFRTEVQVAPADFQLALHDKVLTIGSCFAEVMGTRLRQNKADVLVNPFGTIFNPLSVCLLLQAAAGSPHDFASHLVQHQGIWYAYDLHSSLSSPSRDELLQQIADRLHHTRLYLQEAKLLVITLGTAVAYKLQEGGKVVANCHKLPASNFTRVLLHTDEMRQAFAQTQALLRRINPELNILLTVSPVRHIKETLATNSVSKATLRVLCHEAEQQHAHVHYFPAFEIMLDDLRDYRFYKPDMLHPTEVAEEYIWQKFVAAYYTPDFQAFQEVWQKMKRAVAHRPFHPASEAHQAFLRSTLQQLSRLREQYKIETAEEEQLLRDQLL